MMKDTSPLSAKYPTIFISFAKSSLNFSLSCEHQFFFLLREINEPSFDR